MAAAQSCPVCGSETGALKNGCPRCLLSLGVGKHCQAGSEGADLAWLLQAPRAPAAVKYFFFGDYDLVEEIARGGMGVVFRAYQRKLERMVALKFIRPEILANASARHRFQIEAKAAASLTHANIVPIYEIGEHNGHQYICMRLMHQSLAHRLARKRGLPNYDDICEGASLLVKVALALDYAHSRNVLHLDITPGNILIDEKGEPCLSDFGLAARGELKGLVSVKGGMMGTPAYVAPEQAHLGLSDLGPATDVYGLGATLYQIITGETPFSGKSDEVLRKVLEERPRPPRTMNQAIPAALEDVCLTCLAKETSHRYQSAELLADELTRLTSGSFMGRPLRWFSWKKFFWIGIFLFFLSVARSLVELMMSFWWSSR